MSDKITTTTSPGASVNDYGITFNSYATIEFIVTPEMLKNKDVEGISLDAINDLGALVSKGPVNALIPWSSIVAMVYD